MAVSWIGPRFITSKISADTNYVVDVLNKRNKAAVYPINMLKPYNRLPERVNILLNNEWEDIEREAEPP